MKLSTVPAYPGHEAWRTLPKGTYANAYLNGQLQPTCFAADEEAGQVVCYVMKEHGIDLDAHGVPRYVTKRGKVKLVLVHPAENAL
jgi:hypothetical protein